MAAKKKKIQASDVEAGNRTLEAVLIDMAERMAESNARMDASNARMEAIYEEIKELKKDVKALQEQAKALQEQNDRTFSEIRMLNAGFMAFGTRTEERLQKLEGKAA